MNDAIKTNPGGIIDPQNVVGKDKLIAEIWGRLEQQSVIVSAKLLGPIERSIGNAN